MVEKGAGIALNMVLPPVCVKCGVFTAAPHTVCADCWQGLTFMQSPWCPKCGKPWAYADNSQAVCDCMDLPMAYGRSALVYDEGSKPLIIRFKHYQKTSLARLLAKWLCQAGADVLHVGDVLVPVPMHWRKMLHRKYNQAGLLARYMARDSGLPVAYHALSKHKATPDQQGLNHRARLANLSGAFTVAEPASVRGKHVILVDDVWTTGATLTICTKALLNAGARDVSWLTVARRLRS